VLEVPHDQVNRFLLQGAHSGEDLQAKVPHLVPPRYIMAVADPRLDKLFTNLTTKVMGYLFGLTQLVFIIIGPHQLKITRH
jgi:hypothetical protein